MSTAGPRGRTVADVALQLSVQAGPDPLVPSSLHEDPARFADALGRDESGVATLVGGLVVEPRRGRLVLFSGGGENYHAPPAVTRGRRTTFHAWFKCNCNNSAKSHLRWTAS